MERLVVVCCPTVLEAVASGDEGGGGGRTFAAVTDAVGALCPWVATVETGICSLPARGPARYFGGEAALADRIRRVVEPLSPCGVGIADGLFAARLAAGGDRVVPPGETAAFLAPFPLDVLGLPEVAELLGRLGIRTLGQFASLPERHVLGRFGAAAAAAHRVAGGQTGEPPPPAAPAPRSRRADRLGSVAGGGGRRGRRRVGMAGEVGFWGGSTDADLRAARSFAAVQQLVGPEGVLTPRLQGGRSPAERARFVTWTGPEGAAGGGGPSSLATADPDPDPDPWPGRIPPPAPAVVHPTPLDAELAGPAGTAVEVSGRGLLTATPARLSVAGGPWAPVDAWAGPWPADERWWSRSRRRAARLQAVAGPAAYLLVAERGRWWVEATYG